MRVVVQIPVTITMEIEVNAESASEAMDLASVQASEALEFADINGLQFAQADSAGADIVEIEQPDCFQWEE